ncbi:LCP family glycopolymer transferase [Agromyces sp. SYSU T00194]|uniref:LCP family glycopolymer transferase n=1 Tax=Agromyces chitinivorans TaxID=3158560 RepID=UPI0033991A91
MNEETHPSSRRAAKHPTVARHGRLKKSTAWRTVLKFTASAAAVLMVSGVSVAAYAAWDLADTVQPSVTLGNEEVLEGVPDVGAIDGGVNFLLVGSDSRQGQGNGFGDPTLETAVLNDVTMLLHIAEDHTHASVISFPRDMLVDLVGCTNPETGEDLWDQYNVKINTALAYGGMACVVSTVENLTGVTIPFAGVVQFLGVAGLSEAVGGVEVCVAEAIEDNYTGIFLEPGLHTLEGIEALQFLRTRHGVGDGSDLGRISNQQVFLSALARTLQSDGTFNDPVKLFKIAKAALANMQLSDSLTDPVRMVSIAKAMKDIDLAQLAFIQYPTGYTADGGAVVPTSSADIVNLALQEDRPVSFDENQNEASFASAKDDAEETASPSPSAEATEEPAETSAPEETADAGGDTATASPEPTAEALPSDVYGQTAADTRCSAGRTLADQ